MKRARTSIPHSAPPSDPELSELGGHIRGLDLCSAMPDEPAQAHAARVARLNGLSSALALVRVFHGTDNVASDDANHTLLKVLSKASGLSIDSYCHGHSMYPHRRIVTLLSDEDYFAEQRKQFFTSRNLAHENPRICASCAKSDVTRSGFSWYKRRHDIPGIDRCVIHGEVLWIETGDRPFSLMPHEVIAEGKGEPAQRSNQNCSYASGFVRNYVRAFLALGTPKQPINKNNVSIALAQRSAHLLGGASTMQLSRLVMRQTVTSKAPAKWIQGFAEEGTITRGLAAIHNRFDVKNEYVALAIAAMYSNSEDAIRDFKRMQVGSQLSLAKDKRLLALKRLLRDPSWPAYSRNSAWLGYLASAVTSRNLEGTEWKVIPHLPELHKSSAWRSLEAFGSGSSLREACSMHSSDVVEVERFLRGEVRVFLRFINKLQTMMQTDHPYATRQGAS